MNTASPHNRFLRQRLDALGLPTEDPRHVEAWIRVAHQTLDALSAEEFDGEILTAVATARQAGYAMNERLAASFGI